MKNTYENQRNYDEFLPEEIIQSILSFGIQPYNIQDRIVWTHSSNGAFSTIEMRVHVDCPGCVSKVKKALQRLKGVDNVDIDMALQKVTVTGWADQKKVLRTVRKTGRRAELWQLPPNPIHHNIFATQQSYNQHQHNGPVKAYAPQPSSSYNYYKHGYDYGHDYHNPSSVTSFGNQAGSAFSDENPHGCLIM